MMPQNIVMLSLDGVSQTLFWQYRESMSALWNLSLRSAMFRRFYTSATSSFHSFCDFAYGDAAVLDHNLTYPDAPGCIMERNDNFFDVLTRRGYETLGIQHGSHAPAYAVNNFWGAWPERCGVFQCHRDYAEFHGVIDSFLEKRKCDGKPFALYFSDRAARPDDASPEKSGTQFYHERFEKGFSLLGISIGKVLKTLEELGLLSNTIVVAYGPYGMDPLKHGVNHGKFSVGDPHADMCWTPLLIYNNDCDICIADQLVSSIDLKPTLLHMLFPAETWPTHKNVLSGIDILRFQRQVALSQSLFALENENVGSAKGLARSVAATDGDQRLIVTSDDGIPGEGGMELYFDPRDPGNTRNFLDFFDLDCNGNMTAFGRKDIVHVHFTQSFKPNLVMSIVESFNAMREMLFGFVRFKEQEAMPLCKNRSEARPFPEDSFKRKRAWR